MLKYVKHEICCPHIMPKLYLKILGSSKFLWKMRHVVLTFNAEIKEILGPSKNFLWKMRYVILTFNAKIIWNFRPTFNTCNEMRLENNPYMFEISTWNFSGPSLKVMLFLSAFEADYMSSNIPLWCVPTLRTYLQLHCSKTTLYTMYL